MSYSYNTLKPPHPKGRHDLTRMIGPGAKDPPFNKYLTNEMPTNRVFSSKSLKQKGSPDDARQASSNHNIQTIQSFLSAKASSPS